jgi:hypothetical protein
MSMLNHRTVFVVFVVDVSLGRFPSRCIGFPLPVIISSVLHTDPSQFLKRATGLSSQHRITTLNIRRDFISGLALSWNQGNDINLGPKMEVYSVNRCTNNYFYHVIPKPSLFLKLSYIIGKICH